MGLGSSLKKIFKKVGKAVKKALPYVVGLVATGGLGGNFLPGLFGSSGALAANKGVVGSLTRGLQGFGGKLFGKGGGAASGAKAASGSGLLKSGLMQAAPSLIGAVSNTIPSAGMSQPAPQPQAQDPTGLMNTLRNPLGGDGLMRRGLTAR